MDCFLLELAMLEPKDLTHQSTDQSLDQETISVYDNQAESYAKLAKDTPNERLLSFIKHLDKNAFVLDLGCGPADASATMRSHGLRVDPVDASIEMVRLANKSYDINARQATFTEIDSVDLYDAVWASFSLLHAPRPEFPEILRSLYLALKLSNTTGNIGWLHLAMKLGEGEARDKLGRFYTYYSQEELSDYLTNAGFTIDSFKTGEAMSLAGEVEPWIMFLCQKIK